MTIYPLSDFNSRARHESGHAALPCHGADLVVVAGDVLGSLDHLEFLERIDAPVLLVLGNKDYWRGPGETPMDMDDVVAEVRERLAGGNVTLLERDEVVIDGVRFLGGTMWTDAAGLRPLAASSGWAHNDCRHILARKAWERFSGHPRREELLDSDNESVTERLAKQAAEGAETGRMNPLLHAFLHEEFKEWLAPRLQAYFNGPTFAGPTVVVTHHAPHRKSLARAGVSQVMFDRLDSREESLRFSDDTSALCAGAFGAVADDWLLKSAGGRVSLWIHGGSHCDSDYAVGGVRVVCNPVNGHPKLANHGQGLHRPWLVDACAGAGPVLAKAAGEALVEIEDAAAHFAGFAERLPKAADDVVQIALQEAAQHRAARIVESYGKWVVSANEMVLGADPLWPERLDRVVPGYFGVATGALQAVEVDKLLQAHQQIRDIGRLLHAVPALGVARREYLSRAASIVREKFAAAGYDFTLSANPEGHELAPLWIVVDIRRTGDLRGDAVAQLQQKLDDELRELELELREDGSFEVTRTERRTGVLRVIDLRVQVDGDECFDESDC